MELHFELHIARNFDISVLELHFEIHIARNFDSDFNRHLLLVVALEFRVGLDSFDSLRLHDPVDRIVRKLDSGHGSHG